MLGRRAQHGEYTHLAQCELQTIQNVFDGQRAFFEELFQQGVVAFRHHFDQHLVRRLSFVGHISWNVAFFSLAVAIRYVAVGLHADQVDDALELALSAPGELDGNRCSPEH